MMGAHEHAHASIVSTYNPIEKFRRAWDRERAPHHTYSVGIVRKGGSDGPVPKRTNQSGSDAPDRIDGVMRATCTLQLEFYI